MVHIPEALVHLACALILVGAHHRQQLVEVVLGGVVLGLLVLLQFVEYARANHHLLGKVAHAHLHTHRRQLANHLHKVGNLTHDLLLDLTEGFAFGHELVYGVPHRGVHRLGYLADAGNGGVADAACGVVDDALEGLVVVGVEDDA